jgi:hypothetical protein
MIEAKKNYMIIDEVVLQSPRESIKHKKSCQLSNRDERTTGSSCARRLLGIAVPVVGSRRVSHGRVRLRLPHSDARLRELARRGRRVRLVRPLRRLPHRDARLRLRLGGVQVDVGGDRAGRGDAGRDGRSHEDAAPEHGAAVAVVAVEAPPTPGPRLAARPARVPRRAVQEQHRRHQHGRPGKHETINRPIVAEGLQRRRAWTADALREVTLPSDDGKP